jgi:hypothetical protein
MCGLELFLPEIGCTIDPDSLHFLPQEQVTDLVEGEKKIFVVGVCHIYHVALS